MAGSCYADDTFTVIAEYKLYQTAPLVAVGFTKDEAKSTNARSSRHIGRCLLTDNVTFFNSGVDKMRKFLTLLSTVFGLIACDGGPIDAQAQPMPQSKTEVVQMHCILRPNDSGKWFIQNDLDHSPNGCSLQIEQGPDYLRVLFLQTFTHAGTVQITSDDDFNVKTQGFANLGLNSTMIRVYANGQMINPADVYDYIPKGGGNFWINATMVNKY